MANGTISQTSWTDSTLSTSIKIKATHITELRTAVNSLESSVANVDNCGNCTHECLVTKKVYKQQYKQTYTQKATRKQTNYRNYYAYYDQYAGYRYYKATNCNCNCQCTD